MEPTRRPLQTRNTRWAAVIARFLGAHGVRPNVISLASIVFAAGAGACLWRITETGRGGESWLFLAAAALIQLRLLCNLFDGMVAIEGGFKTKSGEIYNELPDRFADAFILIGAGYSVPESSLMPWLGWLAALLAVLTAYVRALGAAAGAGQQFCGPMAKPHRMAVMTVACVAAALFLWWEIRFPVLVWALGLVAAGSFVTVLRRTFRIIRVLESK